MKGFHGESDDRKTMDDQGTFRGSHTYFKLDGQGTPGEASIPEGVLGVYRQGLPALLAKRNGGKG